MARLSRLAQFNWTSVLDYGAGAIFFCDLIINFHVGFIATYNM